MAGGSTGTSDGGSGGFVLKPWELHGEGREFEKLGRELGKAVGTLDKGLAALGTPWGTDQPGSAFAAVYGPAHGELLGGLRALAGQVGQVGAGLHAMAERTTDTDTSTADGFGGQPDPSAGPAGPVARPAVYSGSGATPGAAPAVPQDMSV
ncbi:MULTISPECIES: hypothetical protein [Kitasatospora]|uniref:WXG100 family type VII secretion target n=1 Tax=Kitasatospora cathayae TaxID=3004092 RepID=A0ABY7Q6C2_9ACTN|nr:hypothetical protein [Kitasatospora sp. HUAS 3-15]WBP88220.1 hypothetical protein O1G21_21890 [Kitasatospora sp. HUAS 3-15]